MPTPNHRDRILTTLHYTTSCRCDRFRSAVDTELAKEPGSLGEHWCWRDEDGGSTFRITGLDLHGDILLEAVPGKRRSGRTEVTIRCREGDLPVVRYLETALGDDLLRPAKLAPGDEPGEARLFDSIADVMQCFQQTAPEGIVVTDAAVESALDCLHGGVDDTLAAIKRLPTIRRLVDTEVADDGKMEYPEDISTRDIRLYLRTWPKGRLVLHRGERIRLNHQLHLADEHGILILKVHFAYVPATREHVIGWVEESIRSPFGEDDR